MHQQLELIYVLVILLVGGVMVTIRDLLNDPVALIVTIVSLTGIGAVVSGVFKH